MSLKLRARSAFAISAFGQGALFAWNIGLSTYLNRVMPSYDWVSSGFGAPFALFVLQVANFQVNYMSV